MHFDSSHNIFVQVVGHKRMLLVSPEQWDELHMYATLVVMEWQFVACRGVPWRDVTRRAVT